MAAIQSNRKRTRQRAVETVESDVVTKQASQVINESANNTTEPVEVVGEPARVRVEGSVTRNLGDFNSIRVGVAIERPCENTDEAIDATYQALGVRVDDYIAQEMAAALGESEN